MRLIGTLRRARFDFTSNFDIWESKGKDGRMVSLSYISTPSYLIKWLIQRHQHQMADVARRWSIWACHIDAHDVKWDDNDGPLPSNDGDHLPPLQWATSAHNPRMATSAHNPRMATSAHHNSTKPVELTYPLPPIPLFTYRTQVPCRRQWTTNRLAFVVTGPTQHDDGRTSTTTTGQRHWTTTTRQQHRNGTTTTALRCPGR